MGKITTNGVCVTVIKSNKAPEARDKNKYAHNTKNLTSRHVLNVQADRSSCILKSQHFNHNKFTNFNFRQLLTYLCRSFIKKYQYSIKPKPMKNKLIKIKYTLSKRRSFHVNLTTLICTNRIKWIFYFTSRILPRIFPPLNILNESFVNLTSQFNIALFYS